MRFGYNKHYYDPDNDDYYDIPKTKAKGLQPSREFDDIHEGRERMISCPVKPKKWWNYESEAELRAREELYS